MAGGDASEEHKDTPVPVEKGFATLSTLRIGVKAFVEKDGEKRKAEILSIQTRAVGPRYYIHYEDFNKRLDEWVPLERIDLTQEVEWPKPEPEKKAPKAVPPPRAQKQLAGQKRPHPSSALKREVSPSGSATPTTAHRPSLANSKEGGRHDSDPSVTVLAPEISVDTPRNDEDEIDLVEMQTAAAAAKASSGNPNVTREEEMERLRTGGSMTQNITEIARVRNINRINMGEHDIEPWYFSPYPHACTEADLVYICEFCLSYYDSLTPFKRHRTKCTLMHPPGNEIYRDDYISFFEIDGRRQRTYCRNLCLLSKLFLDHKNVYYDVDPFLFYCMTFRDEYGCHLVGYFSKEKESADGYNVACILVLPQYQRKGYSKSLIQFSYELSKREGKLGSPEKPLSDLGLLGYRAYWQETIVGILMTMGAKEISVEELGARSSMTTNDVLHTLQNLNMLRYSKGQHVIVLTKAVLKQYEVQKEKEIKRGKRGVNPERLQWKPPTFPANARTWAW